MNMCPVHVRTKVAIVSLVLGGLAGCNAPPEECDGRQLSLSYEALNFEILLSTDLETSMVIVRFRKDGRYSSSPPAAVA